MKIERLYRSRVHGDNFVSLSVFSFLNYLLYLNAKYRVTSKNENIVQVFSQNLNATITNESRELQIENAVIRSSFARSVISRRLQAAEY